jgi:hypothetical protein
MDKLLIPRYPSSIMTLSLRHRIRQIARLVLVFLFFTQAALAMSGCLMPAAGLAKVMAEVESSDCDDAGGMNLNLCHAHCTADQQSLDTGEPTPFLPLLAIVLIVLSFEYVEHPTVTVARVEHTGDPPKPIRFCSFQI